MSDDLTCWSCEHWSPGGCRQGVIGFPSRRLIDCEHSGYEPGSDELETRDAADLSPLMGDDDA